MSKILHALARTLIVLCLTAFAAPTLASNVLVVATTSDSTQNAAYTRLNTLLVGRGDTVTQALTTPANLAPYTIIYDLRVIAPTRSGAELTQYVGFLNAAPGNVLFLLGENVGYGGAGNAPISAFITQAGGGTVAVPATSTTGAQTLTPAFNTPNAVGTVPFNLAGVVTTTGTGAFGATLPGGVTGSVLSFSPGTLANAATGALVVVYDINFLSSDAAGSNGGRFAQNLVNYVAVGAPPVAPAAPVPTLSEWAMILFGTLLAGGAALYIQRRQMAI
ncbi:IPTL-CTERM sorting domain-containing protein [Brevundimonas sp.]|uniref:IPTL-CTERM sorting domain-containing protein n=1 Tax=Brevundimonas sp. TaxID=1871086 RepID=UPI003D0FFE87